MSNSETYKIAYYTAWSGTEAMHQFNSREEYERARGFFDRVAKLHMRGNQLPSGYLVDDYYYLEKDQREAFARFMKAISGR